MKTLSSSNQTARKQHVCDCCGQFIKVGEKYERDNIVDAGTVYSWKSHLSCAEIASKLNMFDGCDEGLTGDDFENFSIEEYQNLMWSKFRDVIESKEFKYPAFAEQLSFVKSQHGCA